jgi:hypothetical protein
MEVVPTSHGLLVAMGRFAAQIGLLDALQRVPVKMKTIDHTPGDKLAELLAHTLAGGMHLKELETSPRPLVRDAAVAQAWGQAAFASASGVSDLLRAATPATVEAFRAAVREVAAPYRRRVLRDLTPAWLVVDFDLTGLVVSDQAATYEGADYGYMGEVGGVAKGYQFARAQVAGRHEALLLGGFLHPGRTVSGACLAELVGLVEAELGRPRRRAEAVAARLTTAERALAALDAALAGPAGTGRRAARGRERLVAQRARAADEVTRLRAYHATLVAENATTPIPRRIILRLDGGFGAAAHVAWLYEQGYDVVARAHSHRVAARLRADDGLTWDKTSKNAWIAESRQTALGACPYPLRLFACRQWRGEGQPERWSALLVTPELAAREWPARRVGTFYNQRQVAEATIKEGKTVLASRHLPTRRAAGIALYQQVVLLAQNLLRWFRRHGLGGTALAAAGLKDLVRVGANSAALLVRRGGGLVLQFTAPGPWQGICLPLRPHVSYQLWFPFLEDRTLVPGGP